MVVYKGKLKRVKVSTGDALRVWLDSNAAFEGDVMIVTCDKRSPSKHISTADVRAILEEKGWSAGRSYTLSGGLLGQVARLG